MLRLNETNTHAEAACASFFNELVAAYQKRDASIKFCLEVHVKGTLRDMICRSATVTSWLGSRNKYGHMA